MRCFGSKSLPLTKQKRTDAVYASVRFCLHAGNKTWDNIHISDADIASDNAYLCVEKELVRVREGSLAVLGEEEIIKKFPRTMYLEDASTVIVLKTPKAESSVRKVWLPKTLAYILREWKKSRDELKGFLSDEYQDFDLVVALPNGRPCEGGVQAPAEPAPALDVQSIILQLQQSPELLSALASLISNQGCK